MKRGNGRLRARRTAAVIAALLTLALVACGPGGDSSAGKDEPLRIGVLVDVSGSGQAEGTSLLRGAQLAAEQINAAGGIDGREVELEVGDEQGGVPAAAASAARRLIQVDGVHAIIGGSNGGTTLATQPITERAKVPLLNASSDDPGITGKVGPGGIQWSFRAYPTAAARADSVLKFAVEERGYRRLAFFGIQADIVHWYDEYWSKLIARKYPDVEIVSKDFYTPGETDMRAVVSKFKQSRADGVLLLALPDDVPVLGRQLREQGLAGKLPLMGCCDLSNPELIKRAGADVLDHAVEATAWNPALDDPVSSRFTKDYTDKYGEGPVNLAYFYWDAVRILAEAVEAGGGVGAEEIKSGLEQLEHKTAFGTVRFDAKHQGNYPMVLFEVVDGKPVYKGTFY